VTRVGLKRDNNTSDKTGNVRTYNKTLQRVWVTIVAVEEQLILG
jgi:hypothetical protein